MRAYRVLAARGRRWGSIEASSAGGGFGGPWFEGAQSADGDFPNALPNLGDVALDGQTDTLTSVEVYKTGIYKH